MRFKAVQRFDDAGRWGVYDYQGFHWVLSGATERGARWSAANLNKIKENAAATRLPVRATGKA